MERLVIQELIKWKDGSDRKPLILNGARQVGKTWLLREFARTQYAKEAYIVCRKNDIVRQLFEQDFDIDRILRGLRAISGVDITPDDTLIVLDEVQEVPEAIESLKYFCEQAPRYHIAVAGSLLGISLHSGVSFPVGKVNQINVYPMSFEEFLLAKGEVELHKVIARKDYQTTNILHDKLVGILREYYYVGGMPEAVLKYVQSGALQEVRHIQKEILRGYDADFSKHAPSGQVPRIRMVWKSLPSQLFKENKKFIYGTLRKGARAVDFELAIQWLIDAGMLIKVPRCSQPALPLCVYEEPSIFKLYLNDVGLLGAMADVQPSQVLVNNDIFKEYKGGFTEHFVLLQLRSKGISPIYYHSTDSSRLEIDFLLQKDSQVCPVEVKAEGNVRANSLSAFMKSHPALSAIRFSMLPYKEQENITNIPLYLA